jgi:hypothetical protein
LITTDSILAYLVIGISVLAGWALIETLLGLATIPLAVDTVRQASRFRDESHYTPAMNLCNCIIRHHDPLADLGLWTEHVD